MAPRAHKVLDTPFSRVVILGIDVKEPDLGRARPRRVGGDAADVDDAETAAVVALEGKLGVDDVLVVVDAVRRRPEEARLLGRLERADVPEVGNGVAGRAGADAVVLVVFVVEDEEGLVLWVDDPALVGVCQDVSMRRSSLMSSGCGNEKGPTYRLRLCKMSGR